MNLIKELQWRGMIQDIIPGTEEQLNKEQTSAYIGFDPTADSLHVGSLIPILLLVHLQRAGHKPYALVGGATGMVGDPSGKSEERNLLDEDTLLRNQQGVKKQLEKYLDFNESKTNAAIIVNNYEWFKDMRFLDFIRDVGKYLTVNYMMAKDSVKKRFEGKTGISFTEFSYQLIQGYDFYYLYKNYNCKLQMGGSDQWGNITTGTELIRRKANGEAFAFTCPLLTKADGGKFGKTEKGNIWINARLTSEFEFYQFWFNASDDDAKKWIKIFTFLSKDEIDNLVEQHDENTSKRLLQRTLAKEITQFVHGENGLEKALEDTEKLFADQNADTASLSETDLENISGIETVSYDLINMDNGIDVVSFLADTKIFSSKGEARKMVQNGGVSINRKKVQDINFLISAEILLHNKYLLVQKGKKNYYLVKVL